MHHEKAALVPGLAAPPFQADSLAHGRIDVPAGKLIHLQFRRFAGCPICSLHLRSFAKRYDEIEAAGVTVVAVFHSSPRALRRYHVDLPFPVVPDEGKRLYRDYGVERSVSAMTHPSVLWAAMKGMVRAPSNPFDAGGGLTGLPGDFLIDGDGRLLDAKYGKHADDHWEVDDVLARRRNPPGDGG